MGAFFVLGFALNFNCVAGCSLCVVYRTQEVSVMSNLLFRMVVQVEISSSYIFVYKQFAIFHSRRE
jgi:hypothetical protein